jgi:DNA-directed RNA polymerase subunit RPC12/RpoP
MADNYLCYLCNKEFPTNAAVDGYEKDFSRGFLCPYCDANLEEADQSDDVWNLKYGYLYMFIMTALLWFGGDGLITVTVTDNEFINETLGMLAVISVPSIFFFLVNIKELTKKRTIYTWKSKK